MQGPMGSEMIRKRRSSRRLRNYYDENTILQMQGPSILEDYEKQLKKFMKFADQEKGRLKTDPEADECLVDICSWSRSS